ncbi:MAG TPA: YwiC-like family protein [Candidatus Angelobacter sp.]
MSLSRDSGFRHLGTPEVAPAPISSLKFLVPREHGSWGMWMLPLITGAITGAAHSQHFSGWGMFWFCLAAASAFLAYQPLEVLLGGSLFKVHSTAERKFIAGWAAVLFLIGAMAAFDLLLLGRGRVLWFGALGVACFALRILLGKARRYRVTRQVLGALSLSSAAAAAYYVAAGFLDQTALLLWGANWLFAAGQIEYVQLRVRTTGVQGRQEKFCAGLKLCAYHLVLLFFALAASLRLVVSPLFAIAFVPALLRIVAWIMSKPAKIDFHILGFSELFQSLLFSGLLLWATLLR